MSTFEELVSEYRAATVADAEADPNRVTAEVKETERRRALASIALLKAVSCPSCGAPIGKDCDSGGKRLARLSCWSLPYTYAVHRARMLSASKAAGGGVKWTA